MSRCCYADEYGELFPERQARWTARRFRRRGLRGSAKRLADMVAATGIRDATILEVGGGVGEIQASLLSAGAARAVNVELSPHWEASAQALIDDLGLAGRVDRRVGDFVDLAGELPRADVVVLHRVLCCYPDWQAMLGAGLDRAGRVIGFTVPVDRWRTRAVIALGNAVFRLRKRAFRAYVHPLDELVAALRRAGAEVRSDHAGLVWRTVVAELPDAA